MATTIAFPPVVPAFNSTGYGLIPLGEPRPVAELIPHPGLIKFTTGYSTQELSRLSERGEAAYTDTLTITHENVILEGYALWQLAKLNCRETVICLVRHLDQEAALLYLLSRNRGSKGIGDFVRVLMALELEPYFKERAKSNQRFGGREKGSAHLAEADRLDVRVEVAQAAGVSSGNVSKVKQILRSAIPEIQDSLLVGEIRINRAASWAKHSQSVQLRHLTDFRNEHGIRKAINRLLRKHESRYPSMCAGLRDVQKGLKQLCTEPDLSLLKTALLAAIGEIDQLVSKVEVKRASE